MRAFPCFPQSGRWLASALIAVVLALASQLALAHGARHHEQPAAAPQAVEDPAAAVAARAVPQSVQAAWSQSCPDGSGGDCCCKHQPAGTGAAKFAIAASRGWMRPVSLPTARPAVLPAETLPQQPLVSPALPRAPPRFS
jgi:hypothetical protein